MYLLDYRNLQYKLSLISGERVMGVVSGGAASSQVAAEPAMLWPVPKHWSLEDAATVPLPYAYAFYCLVNTRNILILHN